ncbi:MAG: hypothetical protein ACXAC8_19275 [Candidatus Hodarchaeales archaeon]
MTPLVLGFMSLVPFPNDQSDYRPQSNNEVDFHLLDYSLTIVQPGVMQFTATIQNEGIGSVTSGLVPISWEDSLLEIALSDGVGTLDENIFGSDLNGDGDSMDKFRVTWFYNNERSWDAILKDGLHNIHAYSIFEGPAEAPGSIRTYNIYGQPKFFQLGNQNHTLYMADDKRALFGLTNATVVKHPSPCFELIIDSKITATEFEISGEFVSANYSRTFTEDVLNDPRITTAYIIPIPTTGKWTGELLTFSCILIPDMSTTSDILLFINWSADEKTRILWLPFEISDISF